MCTANKKTLANRIQDHIKKINNQARMVQHTYISK